MAPTRKTHPITSKLTDEDKLQAAKPAAALDRLVEKYNLIGLAYYYEGLENTIQRKISSTFIVGNSILNAQGIPMCGEYDIKTMHCDAHHGQAEYRRKFCRVPSF